MPFDLDEFRRAMSQFATGVTVVTTRDGSGRPQGLTVTAFCSVSLEPPLVLVCIEQRPEVSAALQASGLFGVSILAEDQEEVSQRFAWGGPEKFAGSDLLTGSQGVVLIPGALAHIECSVRAAHEAGDHVIYVGEVLALSISPRRPLLYHQSGYRRLQDGPGEAR